MKRAWTLLGLAVCGLAAVMGAIPWALRGAGRRDDIAAGMSRDLGVAVRIGGPITIKLFPRPRVQIMDINVGERGGAVDVSAPALSGELDIAAFLRGRWRLASATLSNPTATVGIDRASLATDASGPPKVSAPFRLTIRSGVMRLLSHRPGGADTIVTDIDGTMTRAADGLSGLSVSGSAVWRGMPEHITLEIGAASGDDGQQRAATYLRVSSTAGLVSASGLLAGGAKPQFTGRVTASSAAPAQLFAALGLEPSWVDLRKVGLSGDMVAKAGDVSLSDASLRLNDTAFEGTLGYHVEGGRSLIEGTLATGSLDIGNLMGHRASMGTLYRERIPSRWADANLDLRISAGEMTVGQATAQDVAFSLLCHDRRMEVTLDEALAFGGIVKARLLGSPGPDDIEVHADVSMSSVELGSVEAAVMGQGRMTGTLTGKVAVDGHGQSLGDIVPTLAGAGEVSVENGNFMGISVSQALKRFTRRLPFGADQPGQLTSFAAASSAIRITDGTVNFIDGKVTGPGMSLAFAGHGDLPQGKVAIVAIASPTDAAGALIAGAPALPIEMRGTWGEPLMLTEQSRRLPLRAPLLPGLEPGEILP